MHCLSSSGRRDPRELSTAECFEVIDELERMQVFYVNIGGGEPTVRRDFWQIVDYATAHRVGVKFSANGSRITPAVAERLASSDYVDVQISLDGATAEVNDPVRGPGSHAMALRAMENLSLAGFTGFKISVVMTRSNVGQLDAFKALADAYVRAPGGFRTVWRESDLFGDLRRPQTGGICHSCQHFGFCRGGCVAAKFFTGLPLDGPDPECVLGHGEAALAALPAGDTPRPGQDHSRAVPAKACDENPLTVIPARPPVG